MRQRQAQLSQARIDLERTAIKAPVDGVVVKRSIEPGQTVAASLQAPELFVIARNLTDMQVETSIDEADVGRIQTGQQASFTVDAFAGRTFSGEVKHAHSLRGQGTTVDRRLLTEPSVKLRREIHRERNGLSASDRLS